MAHTPEKENSPSDQCQTAAKLFYQRTRRRQPPRRGSSLTIGAVAAIVAVGGGAGFLLSSRLTNLDSPVASQITTDELPLRAPAEPFISQGARRADYSFAHVAEDVDQHDAIGDMDDSMPISWQAKLTVKPGMIPATLPGVGAGDETATRQESQPQKPTFDKTRPQGGRELLKPLPAEKPAVPQVEGRPWRPANPIDHFILARLKKEDVRAKPLCNDWDFARRASLDLVGVVPTHADLGRFFDWSAHQRRERWIDFLLDQPQYADRWTIVWGDLLRERDRIRGVPDGAFKKYIHRSLLENRPYDEWVREMITASGPAHQDPATAFVLRNNADPALLTITTAQVFLGVQLRCAQCHDHPFDWWTQRDFEGMARFWQGTRARTLRQSSEERIREVFSRDNAGAGEFLTPLRSDLGPGRAGLADLITRRDNPYFARAVVNRFWETLMGVALVNPSDALSTLNPPSHPDLLNWLSIEFIESGYDLKHILRLIANSRTYQQTSVEKRMRRGKRGSYAMESLYAGMPLRPMTAEQIYDSILAATGRYQNDQRFKPSIEIAYPPPARSFLRAFGTADRETLLPRNGRASIQRSLMLLNGTFLNRAVKLHPRHPLLHWQQRGMSASEIVDALFAQILTRKPTRREREWVLRYVAAADRPWVWEDVQWALFNTREFQFIR